jgi:hypothetical protein
MLNTRTLVVVVFCTLFAGDSFGQVARKYSNEFLAIGVGGRGLAMSNSLIASTNDVTSGYWNPAGLLSVSSDLQVAAMHAEYFAGIAKFDYAAIGKRLDSISAGSISVIRFGVDDIPNTTELIDAEGNIDYDRITSFSASDYAFIFSYARLLKPNLRFGANAKVIYRHVGDFATAWGFGLDAGFQYRLKDWQLALMARDVTSTFNAWSTTLDEQTIAVFELTDNEIPSNSIELTLPRIILGVARQFDFGKFSLLPELDLDLTTDGKRNVLISAKPISIDPHLGIEAGYNQRIYVRGGVGNIQKEMSVEGSTEYTFQPNFGLGLRIGKVMLDYALTDIGDQSVALYSNVFSLRFDIHKSQK